MSSLKISCVIRCALALVTLSSAVPQSVRVAQADSKSPAQTITVARSGQAQIFLQSVAGTDELNIPVGSAIPKYSVVRLSAPERIVIDFESPQLSFGHSIKAKNLEHVSGIRVGKHPNKTRIVVDLKDTAAVTHEARLDKGVLVLTVASGAGAQQSVAKTTVSDTQLAVVNTEQSLASVEAAKDTKEAATKIATKKIAPQKNIVANKTTSQNPGSDQSQLVLEEQAVASGSSKTDLAPASPAVAQPSAIKQPTAFERPTRNASVTARAVSADRAMLSPTALEQMMVAAKVISSGKTQEVQSQANASMAAAKFEAEAVQTKGTPSLEKPREVFAKAVEAKQGATVSDAQEQRAVLTKIASIRLEAQGTSSPSLVITSSGVIEHTMTRTAPSEYVVTLHEALTEARILQQTFFASQDSSGIRSVRAVPDGKNTLVRIFTQPSSYLTLKQNGNSIRIEETQDLAQISRDIRAQMAPAAAKEAEASKDSDSNKPVREGNTAAQKDPATKDKAKTPKTEGPAVEQNDGELAAIKGSSLTYAGRLISLDLQDADIDSALRIIAEVSNLNIVAGDGVVGKVTLKLVDVPWDQALEVILKSHGLDKVLEGNVLRVAPVDKLRTERESFKQAKVAEEELEPLSVKYIRVSYAKAAEIKSLVETVLSERGTVAFDERSNQLVVKDTRKGLQNVTELIKKIDLRTPQILLETQIIEANRNLSRQLGAELGFQYIQSPATGNGTGLNFPSAIAVGGSADPTNANSITGSAFPVASTASLGSAVTMLFDSADGTKSLALRLSQLEQEGQVKIISKPAVATTNNKAAEIKSVEKYRVKLPNGGLSIASGSGASSSGSGDVATQTIEAGIILNVTPQASPDYYILLDIKAKSSSFGAKSVDGIPNEIERSASSSVLVSSGQTFALGGIYKITEQDRISGVPFFKDIPILGTLFRNTTTEQSDEELLFFITPRIVEGSFEDATVKVTS